LWTGKLISQWENVRFRFANLQKCCSLQSSTLALLRRTFQTSLLFCAVDSHLVSSAEIHLIQHFKRVQVRVYIGIFELKTVQYCGIEYSKGHTCAARKLRRTHAQFWLEVRRETPTQICEIEKVHPCFLEIQMKYQIWLEEFKNKVIEIFPLKITTSFINHWPYRLWGLLNNSALS